MVKAGSGKRAGGGGGKNRGSSGGGNDRRAFYVLLAVLVIGGIATLSYLATRSSANVSQIDSTVAPVPNQGHVIGSDSATVEVVEFADFECPACGNFANLTEPDIRSRLVNTGLIRFRFVDFPLDIHRNTWAAHSAAWCAGDQGRFWEMHDLIFLNQDRWSTQATSRPNNVLRPLAQQAGLSMDQYDTCVETRKFHPQIRANYAEAIRRGVPSTPTFHIGTTQLVGARSYDDFKKYVDEAIAAKRAPSSTPATKR